MTTYTQMKEFLEGCSPDTADHSFDVDNAIFFYAEEFGMPNVCRSCPDWAGIVDPSGWAVQFISLLEEKYGY